MTPFLILAVLCISFNIFVISYINEEKRYGLNKVDIYIYLLISSFWIFFDFLFKIGYSGFFSFLLTRGTSFFWQTIPFVILQMTCFVFSKRKDLIYYFFLTCTIFSLLLTYCTEMVIDVPTIENGVYRSTYGPLHFMVIILTVILPFLRIIYIYIAERKNLYEYNHKQVFTIMTGVFSVFIVSVTMDVFINYFLPDYTLPHIAALSSVVFSLCLFIAIKNHNFLGPELSDVMASLFDDIDTALVVVDSDIRILKSRGVLKKEFKKSIYKKITSKVRSIRREIFDDFSTVISTINDKKITHLRLDFYPCYIRSAFVGGLIFLKDITGDYHLMIDANGSSKELERMEIESDQEYSKKLRTLDSNGRRFRKVLYNVSEPIVIFDLESENILDMNKAFIDLFKVTPGKKIQNVGDILRFGKHKNAKEFMYEKDDQDDVSIFKQTKDDGEGFYTEMIPFRLENKGVLLVRDYSNILDFENSLIRKERIAISGLMAGSFVSEFKRQHSRLDEIVEKLLEEKSKEVSTCLIRVRDASRKALRILNQLNNFSHMQMTFQMTNINKLIHEEIEQLKALLTKNDISLTENLDGNVTLQCDRDSISILLNNLIINSIHALKDTSYPEMEVRTGIKGNQFLISVRDNGRGIKEEEINKIFRPFYTKKESADINGTGLGLSVSEMIIRRHGGNIEVLSKYGKGTEFKVWLPV